MPEPVDPDPIGSDQITSFTSKYPSLYISRSRSAWTRLGKRLEPKTYVCSVHTYSICRYVDQFYRWSIVWVFVYIYIYIPFGVELSSAVVFVIYFSVEDHDPWLEDNSLK